MKGRMLLILATLLALGVVAPAVALAKPGGTDRPWKGRSTATSTVDVATVPFRATSEGTGNIAHLGKSTISGDVTITPTSATTFTVAGTTTITAANGDAVFTTFTGTGVNTSAETSEAVLEFTITGGTGRFADATGAFTGRVSSEVVSVVGTTATLSQTTTTEGTISY